jgi:hypothetical protein
MKENAPMQRNCLAISIACLGLLITSAPVRAGWLNPFSSDEAKKPAASSKSRPKGTPLVNGRPLVTHVSEKTASVGEKLAQGTKKVATGTVDLVTLKPLRTKSEPQTNSRKPGGAGWRFEAANKKPQKKKTFLGSLFQPKEPPKGPQTIGEWMAMDRPKY